MIDLHCHLLPGIDDGPATLEEAVALAVESHRRGVTVAVATPHHNHAYRPTAAEIADAAESLKAALSEARCPLELLTGAEIALDSIGTLSVADLRERTLGSGDCLLVESPFHDAPDHLEFMINDLMIEGFRVLLAHPERSGYFHSNPEVLRRLVNRGALCSLTAASFRGDFGRTVRKTTVSLAVEGIAANVSSDTHDLVHRVPGLSTGRKAVEGLASQEQRDSLAASLLEPVAVGRS